VAQVRVSGRSIGENQFLIEALSADYSP